MGNGYTPQDFESAVYSVRGAAALVHYVGEAQSRGLDADNGEAMALLENALRNAADVLEWALDTLVYGASE